MLLKEKVAMIAGSNDAVGRATVWAMISAGAKVILISDEEDRGIEMVRAIRAKGGKAIH